MAAINRRKMPVLEIKIGKPNAALHNSEENVANDEGRTLRLPIHFPLDTRQLAYHRKNFIPKRVRD